MKKYKMKKIILHIAVLILGVAVANSQALNSTGKIENLGTIKVKSGQVQMKQDTIDGRVELLQNSNNVYYEVPNMVYNQLVIKNQGKKFVSDNKRDGFGTIRNIIVRDSLVLANDALLTTYYNGTNPEDIIAQSTVVNSNSEYIAHRDLVMRNYTKPQDILANGKFSRLNIDNPFGVNVKSGGFEITAKLTLTSGELRNSPENNFTMKDSTEIERHVGAYLAYEPRFENSVNVTYVGKGSLSTTGEIPSNKSALKNLKVHNTDSLILTKNVSVNDTLELRAKIFALADTLIYNNRYNPVFIDTTHSEISGMFLRTQIPVGERVYFNNPYTYFYFPNEQSKGNLSSLLLDMRMRTFPRFDNTYSKIQRSIDIYAFDKDNNPIQSGFNANFTYGWRYDLSKPYDETGSLSQSFLDLLLQKWDGTDYQDLESSVPQVDTKYGWAYSNYNQFNSSGSYAIGLSTSLSIFLQARVLLEGAYIQNSNGLMRTDLWNGMQGNLLVQGIKQNQFPYNRVNFNVNQINSVPDSVVDWIVLEFRNTVDPNVKFSKLLLVRYDGKIVDLNGNPNIRITKSEFDPKNQSSSFDLVILHRNHASVKSLEPIRLIAENNSKIYDFSQPDFVLGGTAALKLVEATPTIRKFALKAGYNLTDATGQNEMINVLNPFTTKRDHLVVWDNISQIGYLMLDYDMDGIITTRDYNISWNNRNK